MRRHWVLDPVLLQLGTLTPERTLEITTTVLDAFFRQWLQGRPTELSATPPFAGLSVRSR